MTAQDFQNDEQLISSYLKNRNKKSLGLLYRKYYQSVYNICLQYTRSRSDALDLTQDIFLKAFDKIGTLQNRVCFASWLFRIARNKCINFVKKVKKESCVDMEYFSYIAMEESDLESKDAREKLWIQTLNSINHLPETTREILILKYLQNYSLKQLEQKFMLGESAVKMRLLRAKKVIKTKLEKEQFFC